VVYDPSHTKRYLNPQQPAGNRHGIASRQTPEARPRIVSISTLRSGSEGIALHPLWRAQNAI
jgi:hypothetical protein